MTTTPQRRSLADLHQQVADIFDELNTDGTALSSRPSSAASSSSHDAGGCTGARTTALSNLPALIESFQRRRGIQLLIGDEMDLLRTFASAQPQQQVSADELMAILVSMGASSTGDTASASAGPNANEGAAGGSPVPRRRRELSSQSSTSSLGDSASAAATTSTPPSSRRLSAQQQQSSLRKRHSLISQLHVHPSNFSSAPASGSTATETGIPMSPRSLRRLNSRLSSTSEFSTSSDQLSDMVIAAGTDYLGVKFSGPLGKDWDAKPIATRLLDASISPAAREKEFVDALADKTFPQVRSIDAACRQIATQGLLDILASLKGLKGPLEIGLRTLIRGPLEADVELLVKAVSGVAKNEPLLIELLVGRSPQAIALLRAAYARRDSASLPCPHRSLDDAVQAAFAGSSQLRKAFEAALTCTWDDTSDQGYGDEDRRAPLSPASRNAMLDQDLDQLQVALRRGGNQVMVTKILLGRSPAFVHDLSAMYLKKTRVTLTRAIKRAYTGTLSKLLLHVVEAAKKDDEHFGVWRDAKLLERAFEGGPGAKADALAWRLVRIHWDHARFRLVQQAYKKKYRRALLDRVRADTSGALRDLLEKMVTAPPPPEPAPDEMEQLIDTELGFGPGYVRAHSPSGSSGADDVMMTDSSGIFEGDGELMNETFPSCQNEFVDMPASPLRASLSPVGDLSANRPHTSLDHRARQSPLDAAMPPRPASSTGSHAGIHTPTSANSSFQRARPPARARRSLGDSSNSVSSTGFTSPRESPSGGALSPHSARSITPVEPPMTARLQHHRRSSSTKTALLEETEPMANSPDSPHASAIDEISYHARPISPIGETSPPFSRTQSRTERGSLESIPSAESSPEKGYSSTFLRREPSSLSSGESRPSSFFEAYGAEGELHTRGGSGSYDLAHLQRLVSDLTRKLREAESRLEASALTYEQDHSDLEARLEEAKEELAVKRREEKELRANERQYLAQITSLEGDIARLNKSLERSKEQYMQMRKNYEGQCEEAEKLRDLVRAKDQELRTAEDAIAGHRGDNLEFEKERQALQAATARLEDELADARRIQDLLDDQKQENLVLKETIDRLRFDMDEMRMSSNHLSVDSSGASDGRLSVAPSLSRNLGRELARRLSEEPGDKDVEAKSDDEKTEGGDSVDEVIVTHHRLIKKHKKAVAVSSAPGEPVITHREEVTVVSDANVQTDEVETRDGSAQTELGHKDVAHELTAQLNGRDQAQRELADSLGVEVQTLKSFFDQRNVHDGSPNIMRINETLASVGRMLETRDAPARRRNRLATRFQRASSTPPFVFAIMPKAAQPFVDKIAQNSTTLVLWSLVVYLSGVLTGFWMFPSHKLPFHLLVPQSVDQAHWLQYNTLGTSWGEGFGTVDIVGYGGARSHLWGWVNDLVWGSVATARRFPI